MKQMRSAEWVAIDFGVISPNTRMTRVSTPVETPMAVAVFEASPRFIIIRVTIVVISEDADRLTMLLPIRMALSIFCGSSIIFRIRAAFGRPSSSKVRIRILFTVVKAVSAEEKNADRSTRIISVISCATLVGSK